MVDVYLNHNEFKYEVESLIKLFIKPSSFQFINEEDLVDNCNTLLAINIDNDYLKLHVTFKENGKIINQISKKEVINFNQPITKRQIKDGIKKSIYKILEEYYQYSPPWGILTGIRPSKIVNEMMDQGIGEKLIRERLRQHYQIQEGKINLLMEVCNNERPILNTSSKNRVSIYIGIPFCPSKCIYCSFTSYLVEDSEMNQYLVALKEEIKYVGQAIKNGQQYIETIYIGGGTPTTLSKEQLRELLEHIHDHFDLQYLKEFTVECGRPDTITYQKLEVLKSFQVDRISINPQSMKDETLKIIGRKHTPEQIKEGFIMARNLGFKTINTDIIIGLPNEELGDLKQTLMSLIPIKPENITVHTLAIKSSSRLREKRKDFEYMSQTYVKEMVEEAYSLLTSYSYQPYYLYRQKYISGNLENVGYCKKGHECIYNIRIMEEKQTIIGLGAGAVSKVYFPHENRLERVPNVSNYQIYIERIDEMLDRKKSMIFTNID